MKKKEEVIIITIIKYLPSGVLIQLNNKQLMAQIEKNSNIPLGIPTLCIISSHKTKIYIKKFNKNDHLLNLSINIII